MSQIVMLRFFFRWKVTLTMVLIRLRNSLTHSMGGVHPQVLLIIRIFFLKVILEGSKDPLSSVWAQIHFESRLLILVGRTLWTLGVKLLFIFLMVLTIIFLHGFGYTFALLIWLKGLFIFLHEFLREMMHSINSNKLIFSFPTICTEAPTHR